jgi:hypothetical protein
VRLVVRADSDPTRQALFSTLLDAHVTVRLAYRLHERMRSTPFAAILIGAVGLASFASLARSGRRGARVLAVAQHANALRQVERVFSWIAPTEGSIVRASLRPWTLAARLPACARLRPGRARRLLRIIRRIDGRYGFLVACRAAAAVASYARALAIFRADRPGVLLVSSDANPEELGFLAAARAQRIPHVFISHAYPTYLSPPLDFTLSILEGEAAVHARRRKGPVRGEVLLAGVEGDSAQMDPTRFERPNPVVGIFTSKALSWPTFAAIVDDCRRHLHAREIVIRWHPSMLERPRLGHVLSDRSAVVETPRSAQLADVARRCDWVIADENSNVHLPVLKLGIPTVAVKHLGIYPESRADQYGFIANRVIPAPLPSVREMQPGPLAAFFSGSWAERFGRYDAAYLRSSGDVARDVRRAILELIDPPALNVRSRETSGAALQSTLH